MPVLQLIKMKALAVGTVVGDGYDRDGNTISTVIVHVDPKNDREDGRYSDPVVTEDVAKKLEQGEFAKRVGEVTLKDGYFHKGELVNADAAAERLAKSPGRADADELHPQPSALDTRETVAFGDRELVSGGAGPSADDADAAPVPGSKSDDKPADKGAAAPAHVPAADKAKTVKAAS